MDRLGYPLDHEWHRCCYAANGLPEGSAFSYMYDAAQMADEVPRMAMLFKEERNKALPTSHVQCLSCDPQGVPIPDNHLTCCKGVKCSECPALLALDAMRNVTPERIDEAKAWTCAAHIMSTGGDVAREGYLLTNGDRMHWDRVYANLADEEVK